MADDDDAFQATRGGGGALRFFVPLQAARRGIIYGFSTALIRERAPISIFPK